MSRIAKNPVVIPEKVEVNIAIDAITVKGPLGELRQELNGDVEIKKEELPLLLRLREQQSFQKQCQGQLDL